MTFSKRPIDWEKNTINKMIKIYCRGRHQRKTVLCNDCRVLLDYASKRLDLCKFGDDKPTCEKCPVHCYRPDLRDKVKEVMRYAGPRMMIYHPLDAIRHIICGLSCLPRSAEGVDGAKD
ncbi:MAG: nitrous oxide-stimulated promoter family protein [Heliobacteriaceae bacterium]|nr:nitrous oxide-stimulated promoter family protein [Heliobacteriaceae bacterium]